eukprot:COSAG01_NODE_11209_length_1981_cov_4.317216_3_plen_59_part_01
MVASQAHERDLDLVEVRVRHFDGSGGHSVEWAGRGRGRAVVVSCRVHVSCRGHAFRRHA